MKLPVQLLVSGGVTMAAPGAASSVNTLAWGSRGSKFVSYGWGWPVWRRGNGVDASTRSDSFRYRVAPLVGAVKPAIIAGRKIGPRFHVRASFASQFRSVL